MKKNRAIWVALGVLAVAALLMFFIVLPQLRDGKTAGEIAGNAVDSVEAVKNDVAKAVNDAQDTAGDPIASLKADTLAKASRLKADTASAIGDFQALFAAGRTPTSDELAAGRAKLEAALKSAAEFKIPGGVDSATEDLAEKLSAGATRALAVLKTLPADAAGARKAFDVVSNGMLAAIGGAQAPAQPPVADVAATTDKATGAKTAVVPASVLPAFDILRVEPDGSTVIAGKAAPGTRIDVLDAGKVITSVQVGESGDFVAVFENPLAPGDHQLVLQATAKDGKSVLSEEVATVSVPTDSKGELLAMVTRPGEASRIITMPAVKPQTQVATAETAKAEKTLPTPDKVAAALPELPAAAQDIAASAPSVAEPVAKVETPVASEQKTADATVPTKSNDTAAGTMAKTTVTTPPEVMVSAVEIEGDRIFIAGSAKPRSVVRVYADDKLVAEVHVDENGRFVADNTMPLVVGDHTIRADVLSKGGDKVEFRASVPFFRPEGEQLAAVAGETQTAAAGHNMQPIADGVYDKAREEAGKAVGLLKGLYASGKTPNAEELAAALSATEIALKTLSDLKVADDVDPLAKDMASKTATEAAKALALLKSLPLDSGAVKSALNSIDDAVTSAVSPSFPPSTGKLASGVQAPVAGEEAVSNADGGAKTAERAAKPVQTSSHTDAGGLSEKTPEMANNDAVATEGEPKVISQAPLKQSQSTVIIRRGDTLWQISRRVYGRGVRYTTIYVANEGQIANPDLILPGQVFGVPEKPLDNAEQLHRKRLGLK